MKLLKDLPQKLVICHLGSNVFWTFMVLSLGYLAGSFNCQSQTASTNLTRRSDAKQNGLACMLACRMQDPNLDQCWRKSLQYHTKELAQQMENFASILIHINYWKEVNGFRPSDLVDDVETLKIMSSFEVNTIEEVTSELGRPEERDIEEYYPALSGTEIRSLMLHIYNMTLDMRSRYDELLDTSEHLPHLSCPTSCNYYPRLWVALFMVTLTVLILFIITILLYTVSTLHWRKPTAACQTLLTARDGRASIT